MVLRRSRSLAIALFVLSLVFSACSSSSASNEGEDTSAGHPDGLVGDAAPTIDVGADVAGREDAAGPGDDATDVCAGKVCDAPPAAACVGDTLRTYAPIGTCVDGTCSYAPADTPCPSGCDPSTVTCSGCPAGSGCPAAGATECTGGLTRSCEADAGGCLAWSTWDACPDAFCTNAVACGTCEHACAEVDATGCAAGAMWTCRADENGCRYRGATTACPDGFCADESSCGSCQSDCPAAGQTACADGQLRTCRADGNGCLAWGAATACLDGFCLNAAACGTCDHGCGSAGSVSCADGVQWTCVADDAGCRQWGNPLACADGFCADATACGACDDGCAEAGQTTCAAGAVRTCVADAQGCLAWGPAQACPDGFCVNAAACGTCDGGCDTLAAVRCTSGALETCVADADGCRVWGEAEACPDGFCEDASTCGTCANGCPTNGLTECAGGSIRTCGADADGCLSWSNATACSAGFCADATSCGNCNNTCPAAGVTSCNSGAVRTCTADAVGCLAWSAEVACGDGFCASGSACGVCTNQCPSAGATSCSGGRIRTCEADANGCRAWSAESACADGFCASSTACGACATAGACDTQNARQCTGGEQRTCVADANGCLSWSAYSACADGFCADATTCGVCNDSCLSVGATSCSNGRLRTCGADANGCLSWGAYGDCADGFCASASACGACATVGACDTPSATQCTAGERRTCVADANGCLAWSAYSACADGFCANATTCGVCTDECVSEGATGCSNGRIHTCEADANGCLAWGAYSDCADGFCTSATACGACATAGACDTPSATQCTDGERRTCVADANGCLAWSAYSACADGFCASATTCGVCPAACPGAGAVECAGGEFRTCAANADGCPVWGGFAACADGFCADATTCGQAPVASVTCPQDAMATVSAAFDASASSDADGTIVTYTFSFSDGGSVTGANASAEHTFAAAGDYTVEVEVVDDDGATDTASCALTVAPWTPPDITISTNTVLCGEVWASRFTIQAGATVTCPDGELVVHASEVFIDPASTIDLSRTSDVVSGAGASVCTRACSCGDGYTGGSGGGNATAGGSSLSTNGSARSPEMGGCLGSCTGFSCSGSAGGSARGSDTDLSAPLGGSGGRGCGSVVSTCYQPMPGGRGGGAVTLIATTSATVYGTIRVDAGDGVNGSAGSGGGAAGSIVLVGPALTVTGTLSAVSGVGGTGSRPSIWSTNNADAGDGALGRIKLAYGVSYTNTGTMTGVTPVLSVMPPVEVTSTTHPDPTKVYNDGFAQFDVQWNPAFANASGYWYALNRDPDFALTPGNGTYTGSTSASFPRSAFTSDGTWYFHIISSDAGATHGTLAYRFPVHVNATPHTVASASHPNPSQWYANTAVALSWTPPAGSAAASFVGYRYRLDRISGSTPAGDALDWSWTPNTQVVLTNDWLGQPIDGFTYHFHVVAEDTQGNLTSAAAHFRVQIGTAPPTTSVFGYVRDGGGTAIADAEVRIEPYGLTDTTDANGYFLLSNAYQGSYTLFATHPGFADLETAIDVTPGVMPLAVTMTP